MEPRGAPPPPDPGRPAADRRLRGRPGRDRLPRADRAVLRALRHSPPRARAPAEPHPGRAAAGPGPRRRAAHARRPRGRPRGARLALGARGLSRRRGGVRAGARGDRARDGGGRGGARGSRPDAARGRRLGPGARAPPGRGRSTRRRCAPSRSATRGAPSASGGPATPFSPAARCRSAASASWASSAVTALALLSVLGERLDSLRPRPPGGPPVKIGIVCYPTVGGSGAVAAELGKQLARRGPRHPRHLVPPAVPPRRLPAEHLLPRGGRLELPPLRVPAARPRARGEDGGGDARARPRALPRPLRDPPRDRRASSPSRCWATARRAW